MDGVLSGIRVLDVASFIAAPVAATILADFGAEVIKVESPAGDSYRYLNNNPGLPATDKPFHWDVTNRNKRGLSLDLLCPAGRGVLDRLIAEADVLITNFPLPARDKLRLNYDDVAAVNERLIYASLSAYGEEGSEAANPGFDSTAYWARSGLMHAVRPDPDGDPARSMPGQGDHPTGVALFGAIMLALYDRQRTGRGTHVHTSLLANGVWANAFAAQAALAGELMPMRPRRELMGNALTNHYCCADGRWFILTLLNQERDWPRLLEATGMTALADDPRFANRAARNSNAAALLTLLDECFASRDLAHWRKALNDAGVVIGIVGTNAEVTTDEQMQACGAIREASLVDGHRVVDTPLWLTGTDKAAAHRAPTLGEHRNPILAELGYSDTEVKALESDGAFG